MSHESQTRRQGDITIDSNWIIAIGMALLFAFTAFLLGWSIRDLLFDKLDHGVLQHVHSGWLDTLTYMLGAVYFFLFAYSFPAKHLKIAFLLLGAKYLVLIAASYLPVGTNVRHSAAIAGAIASQIAYAIILFAIARWFKTVVRQTPTGDHGVSDS
jgi:hypothetical protein